MHLLQQLRHLYNDRRSRLWVTPALNSVLAVGLALAAAWVPSLLPGLQLPHIERDTLSSLLTVIASSMLAVTTFSLSIMVSAFAAAANGATPRATELLMEDEGTRTAIGAFLSAFIFSVVAQVALGLKYYGDNGRFVLFVGTLLMLAWLIITLIRWVRTLSLLGRFGNTVTRIEQAAMHACQQYAAAPFLGARPAPAQLPAGLSVPALQIGYVRRIDMQALQDWAQEQDVMLHLQVRPGQFVQPGQCLAIMCADTAAGSDLADSSAIQAAILIEASRSFEQDPRFGLIVLSEVGQRAMSAAINDPGSGIAAINAMARVLMGMCAPPDQGRQGSVHDRLTLIALDEPALVHDGFDPIARDGAANLEMAIRLQKLLAMIASHNALPAVVDAAHAQAQRAASRHRQALPYAVDRELFEQVYQQIWQDRAHAPRAEAGVGKTKTPGQ
jgi:uncharacterized membrane protein